MPQRRFAWLGLVLSALPLPGCINDPDCGICDPRSLVLETIAGQNYAGRKVKLLSPACEGSRCPGGLDSGTYFIETIGPCEQTEEAQMSTRGPQAYCKLAPIVTAFGIEFVFNNLLDPESVELVRRRPDNPNLFEVYDWKTQILELQGPLTRYNGDYILGRQNDPDRVTRMVNLSCVDNLRARGIDYSHEDYEDPQTNPCNTWDANTGQPLKMFSAGTIISARGGWDDRAVAAGAGNSCSSPEDGPDTCCTQCDFLLGTRVAKYGLTGAPTVDLPSREEVEVLLARPGAGAIECDPNTPGDLYRECADFIPWVDRTDEVRTYGYAWCPPGRACDSQTEHPLPAYDRLRQTHPDDRPTDLEPRAAPCSTAADCQDPQGPNLVGAACVGRDAAGLSCDPAVSEDCDDGRCVAPWFVQCRASPDTTGGQGYCVDARFSDDGAASCMRAPGGFAVCDPETGACRDARRNSKLAVCDVNEDGRYDAAECCVAGGSESCDPAYQPGLRPVERYERASTLPKPTRECICPADGDPMAPGCEDYAGVCRGREGQYAVKFVSRRGGVIYDPAIKGFEWRPADTGLIPRAAVESCAEDRLQITAANLQDGWRAHDPVGFQVERFEDFDRAMCSGSTYRVVFAQPPGPGDGPREYVRDKVGNTLEGKAEYTFETADFHVVPGSGFPTDNLRIGACDDFSLRFSNKYDMSPENLVKVQLVEVLETNVDPSAGVGSCEFLFELDGNPGPERVQRIAGGPGCAVDRDEADQPGCHPPCLTVDVVGQDIGELGVRIDPAEFGQVLKTGHRYQLVVPGLGSIDGVSDPVAYREAFWDACGMPLILGGYVSEMPDYGYDFQIDEPKCKEDRDQDEVPFSCDNARDFFNPDQGDIDRDGVGDVVDLCPTVITGSMNSADSDNDGVGNECDSCRQTTVQYNLAADTAGIPAYLQVRNVPHQRDRDFDGIGDVCDNCPTVANCEDFSADNPYTVGDPIAVEDTAVCQRDDDQDMVGDACAGLEGDAAAGPVGFADTDDFDQDGIANVADRCPRQPVELGTCDTDEDCPLTSECRRAQDTDALGVCNHLDEDGDGVGDICDTCPWVPNPMQIIEGGAQDDDEDGDFVGGVCETNSSCETRKDPRPFSFFEVASSGMCCVTALESTPMGLVNGITRKPLEDPDGLPVTLDCVEDQNGDGMLDGVCRRLPDRAANTPGVIALPPGCDEALAAAGLADAQDNRRLTPGDLGGDLAALWGYACFLPQFDQDFDGLGDACDLCPFDFDPTNAPYIDQNGKVWPGDGRYCNGEYSIEVRGCGDEMPGDTEGSQDTDTDSGGSTGSAGTDGM
jgi:hypothetical protein